jgi:molybdate transport repressor ModE-like protein
LGEIERTGSIRKAASKLGMSYRHAWGQIRRMGEAAGSPLVVSSRGGKGGGRTRLTKAGESLLAMYSRAESESFHPCTDSGEEIPCAVVSISDGEVVLRSEVDDTLKVTITGGDLPSKTSIGDRIVLLRR